MDNVKVTLRIKANPFYRTAALVAAHLGWKWPIVYFTTKWAKSMKYKVDDGSWKYVYEDCVIDFSWIDDREE